MTDTTFIYALCDPRTLAVRYIGKTDDPKTRLLYHVSDVKRGKRNHRTHWIGSLLSKGLRPILQVVDEVLRTEWQAAEAAYIQFYRDEGCNLVNSQPGGEGHGSGKDNPTFGKPLTPEHRLKIGASQKGKKLSLDHMIAISAARTGKYAGMNSPWFGRSHSLESKAKIGAASKARERSPESNAKRSATLKGRKFSLQHRRKISEAQKGEKGNNFGKKMPPDVRAKLSAGLKAWHERRREQSAQLSLPL